MTSVLFVCTSVEKSASFRSTIATLRRRKSFWTYKTSVRMIHQYMHIYRCMIKTLNLQGSLGVKWLHKVDILTLYFYIFFQTKLYFRFSWCSCSYWRKCPCTIWCQSDHITFQWYVSISECVTTVSVWQLAYLAGNKEASSQIHPIIQESSGLKFKTKETKYINSFETRSLMRSLNGIKHI